MPVISQKSRTDGNCKSGGFHVPCPFRIINLVTISDWDRIKSPNDKQVIPYEYLPQISSSDTLSKLAVLKVNGGLGTSMGMIVYSPCTCPYVLLRHQRREKCTRGQRRDDLLGPYRATGRVLEYNTQGPHTTHPHDILQHT